MKNPRYRKTQGSLNAQNSKKLVAREPGWGFVPTVEKFQQKHEYVL